MNRTQEGSKCVDETWHLQPNPSHQWEAETRGGDHVQAEQLHGLQRWGKLKHRHRQHMWPPGMAGRGWDCACGAVGGGHTDQRVYPVPSEIRGQNVLAQAHT